MEVDSSLKMEMKQSEAQEDHPGGHTFVGPDLSVSQPAGIFNQEKLKVGFETRCHFLFCFKVTNM